MINTVEFDKAVEAEKEKLPLIDSWVNDLRDPLAVRDRIVFLLDAGQDSAVEEMGFPQDLIDVMRLWKANGPDIFTSFSHPEEPDFYKVAALLNLRLFLDRFSEEGREFGNVLVNHYDTISFKLSAKKPLIFGEIGSRMDFFGLDDFGFGGENPSSTEITEAIIRRSSKAIEELLGQLSQATIEPILKEKLDSEEPIKHRRRRLHEVLKSLLEERFDDLTACIPPESERISKSQMLLEFQRNFISMVLGLSGDPEEALGLQASLFSANEAYLKLVRETLRVIIDRRGIGVFEELIRPGEGLAFIGEANSRKMLSVSEYGGFELADSRISDDEARRIILESGIPLGKLESLAVVAGGYSLHMGSERGIRDKILDTLRIPEGTQARRYLSSLRIGRDSEAGNELMFTNQGNSIPIVLAYILLGKEGINEQLLKVVGKTSERLILDRTGAKKLFSEALGHSLRRNHEGI